MNRQANSVDPDETVILYFVCLDSTSSSDEAGLPVSDDDSAFSSSEESVIMLTYPDRHQPRSLSAQKEHAEVGFFLVIWVLWPVKNISLILSRVNR